MNKLLLAAFMAENCTISSTELINMIKGVQLSLEVLLEEDDLRTYYYELIHAWIDELDSLINSLQARIAGGGGDLPLYNYKDVLTIISDTEVSPLNPINNIVHKLIENRIKEGTVNFKEKEN